ncbi:hypothetical protein L210DRAFT_3428716, partial [Boletus edulis BED1]
VTVRHFTPVHQILKDATEYFSRATPNLTTVIPVMDAMDTKLRQHARNDQLSCPIRAGITIALWTLNHYYSLTDSSEVYRIAMILHPRHKLEYFKDANWADDWVDTAERLVWQQFENLYASNTTDFKAPNSDIEVLEDQPVHIKCRANILPVLTNEQKSGNMFDRMPVLVPPKLKDGRNKLDRYLWADVEHVTDALAWWYERCAAYPCLSRMVSESIFLLVELRGRSGGIEVDGTKSRGSRPTPRIMERSPFGDDR